MIGCSFQFLVLQAQYMFVYDCLLYYYLHGNKEVSAESLSKYVALMDTPQEEKEGGATPLDREFQVSKYREERGI